MLALVTGPVRSGKSARALQMAHSLGLPVTYIATARVDTADPEMLARVAHHRHGRGEMCVIELWQPEVPDLPELIDAAAPQTTLLVDSLGTWVAGHMLDLEASIEENAVGAMTLLEALTEPLVGRVRTARANVILVSEETGWGLVPTSASGRIFRDHLGRFVQRLAPFVDRLELVVAGYAVDLKAVGIAVRA